MTTPFDVAEYLTSISPTVISVQACTIAIRGTCYSAARYQERLKHDPSTPAYRDGKREYTREMIYAIGVLPAVKRNGNVAFTIADDSRDWYVAGYYPATDGRKQRIAEPFENEYQRFGNMFLLAPWDTEDSKIDTYERTPYKGYRLASKFGLSPNRVYVIPEST